jgi:hypothetical protein
MMASVNEILIKTDFFNSLPDRTKDKIKKRLIKRLKKDFLIKTI